LKSISKYGKNVKAIAITGSVDAMTTGEDIETRVFNSSQWLPVLSPSLPIPTRTNISQLSTEDAIKAQHSYISYCVAKAEAEKTIWKYVAETKSHYSVSVLLPALIFGPPIQYVESLKINYSSDVFYSLFNGTYEVVPPTSFPSYVCCLIFLPYFLTRTPGETIVDANIWEIDRCPRPSNSTYPLPRCPSSCKSTLPCGRKEILISDSG
jgi:hypothetical protein